MYTFSQFCCLCFRNNIKLKPLRKTTHKDTPISQIIAEMLPQMRFSNLGPVLKICEECTGVVGRFCSFRSDCLRNNQLLMKYAEDLGAFGGEIGDLSVQVVDVGPVGRNGSISEIVKVEPVYENDHDYETGPLKAVKIEQWESSELEIKEELVEVVKYEIIDENVQEPEVVQDDVTGPPFGTNHLQSTSKQPDPNGTAHCCEVCKEVVTGRDAFKTHCLGHRKQGYFICVVCFNFFESSDELSQHYSTHSDKIVYTCSSCTKCFKSSSDLNQHILTHSPYKCDFCEKRFKQITYLKKHFFSHTKRLQSLDKPPEALWAELPKSKTFKCQICGKEFGLFGHLVKHHLIHTNNTVKS